MRFKHTFSEEIVERLKNWRTTHKNVSSIAQEVGDEMGCNFTVVLSFMLKNNLYTVAKRFKKNRLPETSAQKIKLPKLTVIKEKPIFLNENTTIKIGEIIITLPGNSVTINGQKISW